MPDNESCVYFFYLCCYCAILAPTIFTGSVWLDTILMPIHFYIRIKFCRKVCDFQCTGSNYGLEVLAKKNILVDFYQKFYQNYR